MNKRDGSDEPCILFLDELTPASPAIHDVDRFSVEFVENHQARFLFQENKEYRGARRVQDLKTRASRIERRTQRQKLHINPGTPVVEPKKTKKG